MVALAPLRTALRNGDQYTQIWTRLRLLLVRYCRSVHGPARAIRSCLGVEPPLDVSCTSLRGRVARRRTRHFRNKGFPFLATLHKMDGDIISVACYVAALGRYLSWPHPPSLYCTRY